MTILIDTREQRALRFPKAIHTRLETLLIGDYALELATGIRVPIVWERKNLSDLFQTMTSGYERFRQELVTANEYHLQLMLGVEGTLTDVAEGIPYSDFSGDSCLRKLMTLQVKYGVQPVFCQNRQELTRYIWEFFSAVERNWKPCG